MHACMLATIKTGQEQKTNNPSLQKNWRGRCFGPCRDDNLVIHSLILFIESDSDSDDFFSPHRSRNQQPHHTTPHHTTTHHNTPSILVRHQARFLASQRCSHFSSNGTTSRLSDTHENRLPSALRLDKSRQVSSRWLLGRSVWCRATRERKRCSGAERSRTPGSSRSGWWPTESWGPREGALPPSGPPRFRR